MPDLRNIAMCEKVLRDFIHEHYEHTPKPGNKPPEEAMEKYKALSILTELATYGKRYCTENHVRSRVLRQILGLTYDATWESEEE